MIKQMKKRISPVGSEGLDCHNCLRKHRDFVVEESDEAVFKRCTKCHLMSYCDKDCQAKHWNKVHRFHCKFRSGEEPVAGTKHRKEECEMCQEEKKVKKRSLQNPNNLSLIHI